MSSTTKTLESPTREVGLFRGNPNYFDLEFGQQEVKIAYSFVAAPDFEAPTDAGAPYPMPPAP